ncbi:FecR family protein [Aquimarina sp. D1M17]|uniref:FecR family protein n=1 Tax=Aquimarina acroporae TaxID=2937283 RepID=UPI0020BDBA7D|nr:FecR family protein [Aquimarina acroporae]MCK8522095.1 FecR family protein [Aquimarina acroporae]
MEKPDKTNDLLAKWVSNELSDSELEAFEKSKDYMLYKTILEGTKLLEVPETDREKLFDRIQEDKHKETKVKRLIPNWAYGVAASVALIFGVALFLNQKISYESDFGEQLAVTLPDGSEVLLNAKSKLYYKEQGWGEEQRNVFLNGEGYFIVKKGSTFTVISGEKKVSVLGTQFNVITNSNFFEVSCFEGKVKVESGTSSKIISKGERVRDIDNTLQYDEIKEHNPTWIHGESSFSSIPLSQVIIAIEKQYNVIIKSENIDQKLYYTGAFTHDNLQNALHTVFDAMDIKFIFIDNTTIELSEE